MVPRYLPLLGNSWKKRPKGKPSLTTFFDLPTAEGETPCPRSFHAMASVGRSIYIFGGCGPEGKRLNDLYEFNVDSNVWTRHESGPMAGRGGAGLVVSSDQTKVGSNGCGINPV